MLGGCFAEEEGGGWLYGEAGLGHSANSPFSDTIGLEREILPLPQVKHRGWCRCACPHRGQLVVKCFYAAGGPSQGEREQRRL